MRCVRESPDAAGDLSTRRDDGALCSQCVSIRRAGKAKAVPAAAGVPMRMPRIFHTGSFDFFPDRGRTMKKTLASIMTAAFALASVSAFAQASAPAAEAPAAASAPMKKDHTKPKHQLKQHGSAKGKAKAAAASAAGTDDKGTQN
ncbi:hypothetical protein OIV41_32885, partial [Burkholderia pseudomallei]|nr:hypothetical protein [Burkholderia pseudomallei]